MQETKIVDPASFRDPSGFVFTQQGVLYRQVQDSYRGQYERLIGSGLYKELVECELMVAHEEANPAPALGESAYRILRPERIPFLSYPYEWSFSQLKDAALLTLEIQKRSLQHGMVLKDAAAYNIQFLRGRPVLIDTLSFEHYKEGEPWVAYGQFCRHFLAPLALMAHKDIRLNQLFRIFIDGIPLDLAASLLPFGTRFKVSLMTHIHLHARSQKHYERKTISRNRYRISLYQFRALMDSFETAVRKLNWRPEGTEWGDYYECTNYSGDSLECKKQIVREFIRNYRPETVWDLGANTGLFSRIASDEGCYTVSFDIDPAAVEKNYRHVRQSREVNLLPLLADLSNPSPGLGYANRERMSFEQRGPAGAILALALIHHMAISNNVPLRKIAEYFSTLAGLLMIEFVPKNDSQVQRLLSTREDVFPQYTQDHFEQEFGRFFNIKSSVRVSGSERTLYLMQKR